MWLTRFNAQPFNKILLLFFLQLYNHVNTIEIELVNTGKVAFDYLVLDVDGGEVVPCQLNVSPSTVSEF